MSTYPNTAGTMGHREEQKFRGRWAPQVANPTPHRFFKVPPPPAPAKKDAPPPPLPPRDAQPVLRGPDRPSKMNILDRMRDYRALITDDGEVVNNAGRTIGFVALPEAGSADSEFLGTIRSDNVVENAAGDVVGSLDDGRATVMDATGKTVAEIQGTGEVLGNGGTFLGQFEPFSYHEMRTIAVYLLLIDPGMLSEIEG